MRCTATRRRLAEYVYGDLRERERLEIRSHLASCTACRETVSQIEGVLSLASAYSEESPPSHLYSQLREKVAGRHRKAKFGLSLFQRPIPAYAAATAIAILAVLSGVSTRMEVARLERMNALLSDSLRTLNLQSSGIHHSEASDSTTQDTVSGHLERTAP
jgi:anti-sigma factor RsiW